jgi:putative SOS response-associated peptidase YedK
MDAVGQFTIDSRSLLKPLPAERMRAYPVGAKVNSVKNDEAGLIEPMMASGGVRV